MSHFAFNLVGASFRSRDAKQTIRHLSKGTALQLERDPTNAYDSTAVKVLFDGEHLGFVPRGTAAQVFEELEASEDYECHVAETYQDDEADPLKPLIHVTIS